VKVSITGKDIKILEEALVVIQKIRSLGRSLDNPDYIDDGLVAKNYVTIILSNLQKDADRAGLRGDLSDILDKRPVKFEV
jgi:hypothetical protein